MEQNEVGKAVCRGCGKELKGKPYYMGGSAYDPKTGEQCKGNYYGGFVCSESCDRNASLEIERTMPGHNYNQSRLSSYASMSIKTNWN
jgi:hypothetical protein